MSSFVVIPAVAVLVLAMVASLTRKVRGASASRELRDQLGVPPMLWSLVGLAEGSAAVGLISGLAWPVVGFASAAGVALLMFGAVTAHVRVGNLGGSVLPPVVLSGVAVVATLGFATS
jgi:hypothetical protein